MSGTEDFWNSDEQPHERPVMRRGEAIAAEALKVINGARQDAYGRPEDSFAVIAGLWGAYLGREISAAEVADMMCLLKIAREARGKGKRDNAVDLLGYAMIAANLRGYDETMAEIVKRVAYARERHPEWSGSPYYGLSVADLEFNELKHAVAWESPERAEEEALDLIAVLVRFIEGDGR